MPVDYSAYSSSSLCLSRLGVEQYVTIHWLGISSGFNTIVVQSFLPDDVG